MVALESDLRYILLDEVKLPQEDAARVAHFGVHHGTPVSARWWCGRGR